MLKEQHVAEPIEVVGRLEACAARYAELVPAVDRKIIMRVSCLSPVWQHAEGLQDCLRHLNPEAATALTSALRNRYSNAKKAKLDDLVSLAEWVYDVAISMSDDAEAATWSGTAVPEVELRRLCTSVAAEWKRATGHRLPSVRSLVAEWAQDGLPSRTRQQATDHLLQTVFGALGLSVRAETLQDLIEFGRREARRLAKSVVH